ncbi:hypothetical protein ECE50_027035 [Chitinophaga sp. Mgbs1]|uniref:Uncharacterized protein n=1 Tax=Chitinophaga solisilvae TaxID=1233460 RepID=A0A433WIB1_9BACT|nr:hypothetical protein [Chitinophaga solisilvae]
MKTANSILVVERDYSNTWRNLPFPVRKKILGYKGFDGIRWPLYEEWQAAGRVSFSVHNEAGQYTALEEVTDYVTHLRIDLNKDPDILVLNADPAASAELIFLGFDVGVLEEAGSPVFFSGILNEIRADGNPALQQLPANLNRYYLFNTEEQCREYLRLRQAAEQTEDTTFIETAYSSEEFSIVAIYQYII